ncbi:restriction endonuclease subunit S [Microbispora bryophytorum]|uniref:restriction endonuclease subunit S n=1 Tax=Microbispora bryophytorum TaxID=1460882 RepID=UPI003723A492
MNSEWPVVPLRAVSKEAQTGPFGSQLHQHEYVEGGTPVINPSHIKNGKLVPDWRVTVDEEKAVSLSRHRLVAGDLIFARRGELGRSAVVSDEAAGWLCGTGSIRVRLKSGSIDAGFAGYALQSAEVRRYFEMQSVGSTMDNLNTGIILRMPIPLPAMEEQRRIADFLDGQIARIDSLISVRLRQCRSIEERISAEVSEVLVPGILGTPGRSNAWPWLPDLPSGLPIVRLGYLSRLQSGITVHEGRELDGDIVTRPYLRVANVQAGQVDLSEVNEIRLPRAMARRSTLRPGDVLMTEGGDLDKLGRGTVWRGEIPGCLHQNHVFAIRPDRDKLDGEYLSLVTQSMHGRWYFESTGSKTTNLASTNSSKIMGFPIPLRELDEQRRIVRSLNASRETMNRVLRTIDRQLMQLAERRQALITAAVTGQIDVTTARGA